MSERRGSILCGRYLVNNLSRDLTNLMLLAQTKAVQIRTNLLFDIESTGNSTLNLRLQPFDFGAELAPFAQKLILVVLYACRFVEGASKRNNLGAANIRSDESLVLGKVQLLVVQQRELVGCRVALWQTIPDQPAIPHSFGDSPHTVCCRFPEWKLRVNHGFIFTMRKLLFS